MSQKESYKESDRKNLRLVVGLARTMNRENRETAALLSEYRITIAQFGVLEALYHLGDLKIGEIIEKTLSTGGNMTVVVRNLEKEGFVIRKCDPNDRRSSLISLLPKGVSLMEKAFPQHLEQLRERYAALDDHEKDQLSMLLKKINGKKPEPSALKNSGF